MKKTLSLCLAFLLALALLPVSAEQLDHPAAGTAPELTVEISQTVTENPFAESYNKEFASPLPQMEQEYYANIDTYIHFKNAPAPFLYVNFPNTYVYVNGVFLMGNYLIHANLINTEDLLNRFNLLYAEMRKRGLVAEGVEAALVENLVDASRLAKTSNNPLESLDNTTLYNNTLFNIFLLEQKEFLNAEQAAALLGFLKRN